MTGERVKDTLSCWLYLVVAAFGTSLILGVLNSVGIFIVVFVEYYEESNTKAGWIGATLFFLACIGYPLVVFLRRHFEFYAIVLCTSILIVFTFVSTPFMPSLDFVFLTYSIPFGIAAGFLDCLSVITIREYFDRHLGLATGIRFASIGMLTMVYNYLLPIFFDAIGWKKTFFALSSLAAMCVVYAMAYHNPDSGREPSKLSEKCELSAKDREIEVVIKRTSPSYAFLRKKKFLFILIGSVPFVLATLSPPMFMIQYAKSLGYPLHDAKWLLIVYNLASLLGRLVIGRAGDFALRKKKVTHISQASVILFGIASGLCSLTQSLPLMILCMGFIGLSDGIYWVNLPLMSYEVTSGADVDEAYCLLMLVTAFGMLAGPPLTGWIYDVSGEFRYVLYIVATCGVTGGFIMGIGTYAMSQENDTLAQRREIETKTCSKTSELNHLRSFGITTVFPDEKILSMVEYESAV